MSSSNCCFPACIQITQEAGQVVWYSHLFKNFTSGIHWLPQVHKYPPSLLYSIHSSSLLCTNIFSFLLLSLRNKKCLLLHLVSLDNAQIHISPIVLSNVTVHQLLGSQLVATALNRSIWERGSQNRKTRRNHVPGRENDVNYKGTKSQADVTRTSLLVRPFGRWIYCSESFSSLCEKPACLCPWCVAWRAPMGEDFPIGHFCGQSNPVFFPDPGCLPQ